MTNTNIASGAAMQLADQYAAAHAKWALEDLYGTSKSYTAKMLKERHALRSQLAAALASAAAPAEQPDMGNPITAPQPDTAYAALPEHLTLAVNRWFADNTGLGGCSDKDVRELAELFYGVAHAGGRESVDDALAIVESFGPGIGGLNDTYARQILLAEEVKRLRAARATAPSVTAPAQQGKWTWVPVEPSTAMLVAGNHGQPGDFSALKVWEDMLGALDRSFDYTRPVDPPSTTPPTQAADSVLEDAARYRWLREKSFDTWKLIAWNTWNNDPAVWPDRDAAIDAARKQGANHD